MPLNPKLFVNLTYIIAYGIANRPAADIRYYVSSNILRIFAEMMCVSQLNDKL